MWGGSLNTTCDPGIIGVVHRGGVKGEGVGVGVGVGGGVATSDETRFGGDSGPLRLKVKL